jgi:hypothetical protein
MLVQRLLFRARGSAAAFSTKRPLDKNLIKQLREASGAPITDCKKALEVCIMWLLHVSLLQYIVLSSSFVFCSVLHVFFYMAG